MVVNKFNLDICNPLKLPKIFQNNYIWKFDKKLVSLSDRKCYSSEPDKIYTRILNDGDIFGIRLDIDEK